MAWLLEWGKYAVLPVYLWFAAAYWVGARRNRHPAWWAAGIPWIVYGLSLRWQTGLRLGEFSTLISLLLLLITGLPLILIMLDIRGKRRVYGYAYIRDLLLFRHPQLVPLQPHRARYETIGIVLLMVLAGGITLVSTGLRPCHLLDWALGISGCQRVLTLAYPLQDLAFSQDGQYLAATGDELYLWHSDTWKQQAILPNDIEAKTVALAPNNQLFAVGGAPFSVELRSLANNAVERRLAIGSHAESLAFSPDGRLLSAGAPGTIYIWNVADGKLLHTLVVDGDVYSVVFAPNGRWMASGGFDGHVTLWSVPDFTRLHTFRSNTIYQLAFSPDSELLATAQFGDRVTVWRVSDDYQQVWTFSGRPSQDATDEELPYEPMWSIAYTPDGKYLVSGSATGALRVLQAADGQVQTTLQFADQVHNVAVSPDGQTLAIGLRDNTVRLWRWSTAVPNQTRAAGE